MSSMRNAVQRRNHRERAQPLEREKWGVLEKHKVLCQNRSTPYFSALTQIQGLLSTSKRLQREEEAAPNPPAKGGGP